ncbi:hypothetical protein Cgig2_033870 [Carnegiea gigantea]|uniref:Uncharacterized protein n=1 Tax=Carnegiea gigantea TaxID=171969 RepID=A0A9Q1JXV2_9CARY|nr:hypothetical protein Cgig2_033870 [Carnegiea gigantea]
MYILHIAATRIAAQPSADTIGTTTSILDWGTIDAIPSVTLGEDGSMTKEEDDKTCSIFLTHVAAACKGGSNVKNTSSTSPPSEPPPPPRPPPLAKAYLKYEEGKIHLGPVRFQRFGRVVSKLKQFRAVQENGKVELGVLDGGVHMRMKVRHGVGEERVGAPDIGRRLQAA